jgi:hypothetical protein
MKTLTTITGKQIEVTEETYASAKESYLMNYRIVFVQDIHGDSYKVNLNDNFDGADIQ